MSFDPDFHEAADAWLDAGTAEGQGRILLDILRDSPAAAREFATLARVQAVLETAPLSESERFRRAAKLLRIPLRKKALKVFRWPAVRWGAAAALAVGGLAWAMIGSASRTEPAQARHSNPPRKNTLPLSAPAAVRPPESLPPADPAYVKRMDSLLIPDFEAVDLSLEEAVSLLTRKAAALDSSPLVVSMGELREDLPEKRVNLKLKYQPVSTLLKLIAVQTVMKIRETGQSYHLTVNTDYDPSDVDYRLVHLERWDSFLESQGLMTSTSTGSKLPTGGNIGHESGSGLGPPPPAAAKAGNAVPDLENFRMTLLGTLRETPASVEIWTGPGSSESSPSLNVGSGQKLNAMLELLLAGPDAPGTLTFDLRWVTFKNHAALERMLKASRTSEEPAARGEQHLWDGESLPRLLKALAEDPEAKMESSSPKRIAPGRLFLTSISDSSGLSDVTDDNWAGRTCSIQNNPVGDRTTISLHVKYQTAQAAGGISAQELTSKLTLPVGSTLMIGGPINEDGEKVIFITARLPGAVPYGIAVPDRPGFVRSPYAMDKGMVDVAEIPQGTKVKCPYSGQTFRVP